MTLTVNHPVQMLHHTFVTLVTLGCCCQQGIVLYVLSMV